MNSEFRRHNRSQTITRFEDFKIKESDTKLLEEITADLSTKETPLRHTPIDFNVLTQIQQMITSIQQSHESKKKIKETNQKILHNRLLEIFFKACPSKSQKNKKKSNNPNKSLSKSKKSSRLKISNSSIKISDLRLKKVLNPRPKRKLSKNQSVSLARLTSRSLVSAV